MVLVIVVKQKSEALTLKTLIQFAANLMVVLNIVLVDAHNTI